MTKLVFFGNEKLATGIPEAKPLIHRALEDAGYEIEQHVTGPLGDLKPHEAKLAVLAAYGRILPQRVLDEFPLGIINIHPSLLPIYRGPTPIEQAILDGAPKTGVSIMRLTAAMDEGPVYKQKGVALTGHESKADLAGHLQALGAELLLEVLPGIASGELKPRQQPHPDRDASYTKLIRKADGAIDWAKPATQLEREVRAYLGWPGSFTAIAGTEVIITAAEVINENGPAGQPFKAGGSLAVYCGKEALKIIRLKPSGKREMTGSEFLAGHPIS